MTPFPRKYFHLTNVISSLEQLRETQRAAKTAVTSPSGVRDLFGLNKLKMFANKASPALTGLATGVATLLAGGVVTACAQHLAPHASSEACLGLFAMTTVVFGAFNTLKSFFGSKPEPKKTPSPEAKAFRAVRKNTRNLANAIHLSHAQPVRCTC